MDCEGKDPQKELYVYLLCVCVLGQSVMSNSLQPHGL